MIKSHVPFNNVVFFSTTIILYVGMLIFSYRFEMDPYLWFDDAGQFWISQGLNHDSDPLSPMGDLLDVIINNAGYNYDPGGFGILLHFWSMISTNYLWLRSLSLCFFLISVFLFGYLSYLWTKNIYVSIWASFVPFFIPMIFYAGFYIRAYSMEVLGCLVCVLSIFSLQSKISNQRVMFWSVLIAFFLTSRYSFIVVAFVTSLYILYLIYRSQNSCKTKFLMILGYSIPLFLVLTLIYFVSFRYQNPELKSLSYLPYVCNNWRILFHKASLRHLFYLFVIVWVTYAFRDKPNFTPYRGLVFVTLSSNVLFFLFSCMGVHPWDGGTNRCISMITLVIISITALWCEILNFALKKINIQYLLLAFIFLRLADYSSDIKASQNRVNMLNDWKQLNINTTDKVFVDRSESPCLRYQMEFGALKSTLNYPANYTFIKFRKHCFSCNENVIYNSIGEWYRNTQPELNDLYDTYNILVAPELYGNNFTNSDKWKSINGHDIIWVKSD